MYQYLIVAGVAVAAIGGAATWGYRAGHNAATVQHDKEVSAGAKAADAAASAVAEAIGKLRIRNVTVRETAATIIREKPIYRDCVNDDGVMRAINAARGHAASGPASGGGASVPAARPAD